MSATIVFIGLFVGLFALSYIMKRRFGVLGLALAAGALISEHWTGVITPLLQEQGITLMSPPLAVVVAIVLTLLPAVALLFSGSTYGRGVGRLIGSFLFALLAFTFLLPQIGTQLEFDEISESLFNLMTDYRPLIIVGGLTFAVIDVFLTRTPKKPKKGEH